MPLIGFIRHAPTTWNEAGRIQGRTDTPLSEAGRAALATWELPTHVSAAEWWCSPLQRCRDTARHLAGREVQTDPLLQETHWGEWQGETLSGLREQFGDEMRRREELGWHFSPPGGESPRDVAVRLQQFLAKMATQDQPLVVVTHRGVIRVALALATGWDFLGKEPFKMTRAAVQEFWLKPDGSLELRAGNVAFAEAMAP
ncbi:MAG: histidine phosphatase family protein [Alphaproteobacteria bacterium]|jgi:probable phosphoglycerate mutase